MQVNENFGSQIQQLQSSFDKKSGPMGQEVSNMAHEKNIESKTVPTPSATEAMNQQIIASTLDVSFATVDDSSKLLLKTAIEEINNVLKQELGISLEEAAESGIDVSPEATAERIVSLSTSFFSAYHEQHPEMDLETAVAEFTNLIGGGIDQGFSEARGVLEGLSVLEGDIASNIDKTYDLVQGKMQEFIDNMLGDA